MPDPTPSDNCAELLKAFTRHFALMRVNALLLQSEEASFEEASTHCQEIVADYIERMSPEMTVNRVVAEACKSLAEDYLCLVDPILNPEPKDEP